MLVFECPLCKTKVPMLEVRGTDPVVCPTCLGAANVEADPAQAAMLQSPGLHKARKDDEDDEGITEPKSARPNRKHGDDDDDDDDDKPRKKRSSGSDAGTVAAGAAAGAGMGIGMVLLIIGGI